MRGPDFLSDPNELTPDEKTARQKFVAKAVTEIQLRTVTWRGKQITGLVPVTTYPPADEPVPPQTTPKSWHGQKAGAE